MDAKKLFRSKNRVIGGVCNGIGEYFVIDPVIVRIIFVLTAIFGAGILVYLVLWIMLPENQQPLS